MNTQRNSWLVNRTLPLVLAMLTGASASAGAIVYVDDDAPAGGNGSSWATAYRFVQQAVDDVNGGGVSEIRIAQGVYKPDRDPANPLGDGDRQATYFFHSDGVLIKGGFAGIGEPDPDARDIELYPTVLSGDLAGNDRMPFVNYDENSYRIIRALNVDGLIIIDGITVTGGNADGSTGDESGGGVLSVNSSFSFIDTVFYGNKAREGGAVVASEFGNYDFLRCSLEYNAADDGSGGALTLAPIGVIHITECVFQGNSADSHGGAVMINTSFSPATGSITDCQFLGNSAGEEGGALKRQAFELMPITNCLFSGNDAGVGGAVRITDFTPLTNCEFDNNSAGSGGAFFGQLVATECTFTNNTAHTFVGGGGWTNDNSVFLKCRFEMNSAAMDGGGLYADSAQEHVLDCRFNGNSAEDRGGAVFVKGPGITFNIINCTVANNTADQTGGIWSHASNSGKTFIRNCVLYGNSDLMGFVEASQVYWYTGEIFIDYSCIQQWTGDLGGAGNIDDNPDYVDFDGADDIPGNLDDDLHLAPGSSAIDAGNNWAVPIDVDDFDEDGVTDELFPVDLDGQPRFSADEVRADPGCGVPVVVDLGAYEYQFVPVKDVIFADLNGDGLVNAADLAILLGNWGPCGPSCCLADLDLDGIVGAADLAALLGNWG